ncbi:MAG: T9SS type A sorting domain-containing protein [Bacteroidetes bacterium]|nr:T9SS type A sorting domain-containing protein [Bacteroidota bacterium]
MGDGIDVDRFGNVYAIGSFYSTIDCDPSPSTYNFTSIGSTDIFILKLSAAGNFLWARRFGSSAFDYVHGIVSDSAGNVLCVGNFSGTIDFDPGPATLNLTSSGGFEIIVLKLNQAGYLPVTWLNFEAIKKQNTVLLNWQTASEINNNFFEIERSFHSDQNWQTIGRINAKGNHNTITQYASIDALAGVNHEAVAVLHYRIKQIDVDGKYSFSEIRTVTLSAQNNTVLAYPNPYSDQASLFITAATSQQAEVFVFDMNGKQLFKNNYTLPEGETEIRMSELITAHTGVVFVKVIIDDQAYNLKLFRMN